MLLSVCVRVCLNNNIAHLIKGCTCACICCIVCVCVCTFNDYELNFKANTHLSLRVATTFTPSKALEHNICKYNNTHIETPSQSIFCLCHPNDKRERERERYEGMI